jgi:hypothetical protein
VLAQFRSNVDLAWVRQTRAALGADEAKYKLLREKRASLKRDSELWQRIENGVGAATIVVADPEPFDRMVRTSLHAAGAVNGVDFRDGDINARAATALLADTPIAWLPRELEKVIEGSGLVSHGRFSPNDIRLRIGPQLRQAAVFAARAHATFDVSAFDGTVMSTRDVFRSPLAKDMLCEILSIPRVFDEESAAVSQVLNEASDEMARALANSLPFGAALSPEPLVREADSRSEDLLQAADIAAGWARDVIDTAGIRALGLHFERVCVNGNMLKGGVTLPYEIRY